jgi:hypothetical protein
VFLASGGVSDGGTAATTVLATETVLACGHVEASLDAVQALGAVVRLAQSHINGTGRPTAVEEDSVEVSDGTFSLFFPRTR